MIASKRVVNVYSTFLVFSLLVGCAPKKNMKYPTIVEGNNTPIISYDIQDPEEQHYGTPLEDLDKLEFEHPLSMATLRTDDKLVISNYYLQPYNILLTKDGVASMYDSTQEKKAIESVAEYYLGSNEPGIFTLLSLQDGLLLYSEYLDEWGEADIKQKIRITSDNSPSTIGLYENIIFSAYNDQLADTLYVLGRVGPLRKYQIGNFDIDWVHIRQRGAKFAGISKDNDVVLEGEMFLEPIIDRYGFLGIDDEMEYYAIFDNATTKQIYNYLQGHYCYYYVFGEYLYFITEKYIEKLPLVIGGYKIVQYVIDKNILIRINENKESG